MLVSEADIKVYKRNGAAEDRQFVPIDHSVLRHEIDVVWVSSAGEVVYADGPGVMRFLVDLIIAVDIHGEVGAEIVGYAIGVAVRIQHALGAGVVEGGVGQGDGAAGVVKGVAGKAEAV